MKGTVLITSKDSPLGGQLTDLALESGYAVVATSGAVPRKRQQQRSKESDRHDNESLLVVPWSSQSALSAQNVVLRGVVAFDAIDEAIIVFNLTPEPRPLHEVPIAVIQESIDTQIKSHFFLVKELLHHFLTKRKGVLSMVLNTCGVEAFSTLDSISIASFQMLVKSLHATYQNEPIIINGFESGAGETSEYASFIMRTLDERGRASGGKWYRLADKANFRPFSFRRK